MGLLGNPQSRVRSARHFETGREPEAYGRRRAVKASGESLALAIEFYADVLRDPSPRLGTQAGALPAPEEVVRPVSAGSQVVHATQARVRMGAIGDTCAVLRCAVYGEPTGSAARGDSVTARRRRSAESPRCDLSPAAPPPRVLAITRPRTMPPGPCLRHQNAISTWSPIASHSGVYGCASIDAYSTWPPNPT